MNGYTHYRCSMCQRDDYRLNDHDYGDSLYNSTWGETFAWQAAI